MNTKQDRLSDLRKLISGKKISGQEALLAELSALGHNVTQATLSRDLKEIRAGKKFDSVKGIIYVLQEQASPLQNNSIPEFSVKSIQSVVFSYNLVLIKTYPGFASSIALYIDNGNRNEIAGTIAGDDTLLLVPQESYSRRQIQDTLESLMPGISPKFS